MEKTMTSIKPMAPNKFIIRIPYWIRDKIGAAAQQNDRTMNAEILYRLIESFEMEGSLALDSKPDNDNQSLYREQKRDERAIFNSAINTIRK